jgi:hypothetical protein
MDVGKGGVAVATGETASAHAVLGFETIGSSIS